MIDPAAMDALRARISGEVRADELLAKHTTFCIGGPAEMVVLPASVDDVRVVMDWCLEAAVPLFLLGGGSNVLPLDEGVRGVVLCTRPGLGALWEDRGEIVVGAGVEDPVLAAFARDRGWAGLEWIDDLPGTVGGAVFMNAGNNDGEMAANTVSVSWLDREGTLHTAGPEELAFGYRQSRFQGEPGCVVEARLRPLGEASPAAITERMDGIRETRRRMFPPETMCAGSVFRRPAGDYAGRLIEAAGCGGMQAGAAKVSEKHKGFIVNTGGATSGDVLSLIHRVQERVKEEFGVELQREVEIFGTRRFL
ncbi:MAG: UDP-N-acetylmuramate dehydrogenase [Pseudomonadota bacterium]